jgi:drug/metabolite transporter (DMT)-like permease
MSTATALSAPDVRFADLLPSLVAALSFSSVDILTKVVYASGMDVMTLITLRGVLVVACFRIWLRLAPPAVRHGPRQRMIAIVLGVLFAFTMLGLMEAIALLPVSIAILAYFVYPLLTGIVGAATGVERLNWRALLAALAAFVGLALMLGAQYDGLSMLGLVCAFGAASGRVVSLLLTKVCLDGTDARLTTWYSILPSTALFVVATAWLGTWNLPQSGGGWSAFVGVSIGSTLSTLLIYISTNRVGPFRTALTMNLEPLVTTLASIALLGEMLSPLQALGAGIMLASLCAFQFARGR